jgi:hypothetical protein
MVRRVAAIAGASDVACANVSKRVAIRRQFERP